jgi:hypothetical protein
MDAKLKKRCNRRGTDGFSVALTDKHVAFFKNKNALIDPTPKVRHPNKAVRFKCLIGNGRMDE